MHELRDAPEPSLDELVRQMSPVDLLLVEGFKRHPHPKIEIYRPSLGKPLLHPDDPHIVAIASDERLPGLSLPWLPLSDATAVAGFILGASGAGLMAQLSDDCFAFGGALLTRRGGARADRGRRSPRLSSRRRCRCRKPPAGCWRATSSRR